MRLTFHKYQGTGNDFILLDNRQGYIRLSREQVARLCHRRFGIGADGLMLLEDDPDAAFRMVYYNSDGGESTMCGNGGRCIVAFARALGIIRDSCRFAAIDGMHDAHIQADGLVRLEMRPVAGIERHDGYAILDTGSPHYVQWVNDASATNVFEEGRAIRKASRFGREGINVNFVARLEDGSLSVRTYERGVEDETLSCGTGVTAAAIAASGTETGQFAYDIQTPGGPLKVSFIKDSADSAGDVVLCGPAEAVFSGDISL